MRLDTEQVLTVSASALLDNGFTPTGFQRSTGPPDNVDSTPAGRAAFSAMGNIGRDKSAGAAKVVMPWRWRCAGRRVLGGTSVGLPDVAARWALNATRRGCIPGQTASACRVGQRQRPGA